MNLFHGLPVNVKEKKDIVDQGKAMSFKPHPANDHTQQIPGAIFILLDIAGLVFS